MYNMKRPTLLRLLVVALLCWTAAEVQAQWTVGLKGGITLTEPGRTNMGRVDETYSSMIGVEGGLRASYEFTDVLSLRMDLSYMQRTHYMKRNLNYLNNVFTIYTNSYLMLPIMAECTLGEDQFQVHMYFGGYGGYWMRAHVEGVTYWMTDDHIYFEDFDEKREFNVEDQRWAIGLVGGIGVSFDFTEHMGVGLEALYYYDLSTYHKGYTQLTDPRYLSTLSINLSLYYRFFKYEQP